MAGSIATNYNTEKIFLGNNKVFTATYTNATGSTATLTPGQVFGRVTATNKVLPCDKDATDGSQFPRFVLRSSHTVANAASATVTMCYAGDVDADLLTFASGESLTTVVAVTYTDSGTDTVAVSFGTMHDLLLANSQLNLIRSTQLSNTDNA